MRIAIFSDTFEPEINGVVTSIQTLKTELEKRGHYVVLLVPKNKELKLTEKIWQFPSIPLHIQGEYRLGTPLSKKCGEFKKKKFDIVHIQTPFSMGYLGQYLAWKNKIPIVYTYHTIWSEYLHCISVVPKVMTDVLEEMILSKSFCNRCSHIIAPTHHTKKILLEYKVHKPISIMPTGIILHHSFTQRNIEEFKKKHNIIKDENVLMFVGRLGKEKNLDFLLHCFKSIHGKNPKTKLCIIGDGPERKYLEEICKELKISQSVVFFGNISHSDVPLAYAASDIVTFPSKTETQGLSLIEGLSMGKPAVCLKAMGVQDILRGSKGGILTKESVKDYSSAVLKLLSNEELYSKKSKEAFTLSKKYSASAMGEAILKIYAKAIK